MADIDSTPTAPSASESSPNGVSPNEAVPLDLKLKIVLGNGFSVELARNRLAECSPEVVALLASKYASPCYHSCPDKLGSSAHHLHTSRRHDTHEECVGAMKRFFLSVEANRVCLCVRLKGHFAPLAEKHRF